MKWLVAFTLLLGVMSAQAGIIDRISGLISSMYGSHEETPYVVVRESPGYEGRIYPPNKWACIKMQSNKADVMEGMFWRLFNYYSGRNEGAVFMPMTVPVTTEYKVLGPTNKEYTMCFYFGKKFQENPPMPLDHEIYIENRPQLAVLTRAVGGYFETEEDWIEEAGKLAALITRDGEHVSLDRQFWAGYDAPLKFWNRRNEVWLFKI